MEEKHIPKGFKLKWTLNLDVSEYDKNRVWKIFDRTSADLIAESIHVCKGMVDKTTQLIEKKFQHINSSEQNPDRIFVTLRDHENKLNTQLKRTKQRKSKTLRQYNHSRIHNKTSTIERQNELRDSEVVKL